MTVCPCSLAISDQGAHSQRAVVSIRCRFSGFVWLEELIEIAEGAGSSPVFALLKREDEKHAGPGRIPTIAGLFRGENGLRGTDAHAALVSFSG